MQRFLALLLALSAPSCAPSADSAASALDGDAAAPCLRCTDWLAFPGSVALGSMCVASFDFAVRVVDCATLPPGLGDCPDINLSRPPNAECLAQLDSECPQEITDCEQDLADL
jgi:hypothetical protein